LLTVRRLIALFTALALGAASCAGHPARAVCVPTSSAGSSGSASQNAPTVHPRSALPHFSRVVVVVMENKDYSEIIGNPEAPYLNSLTRK
jgi:acid phosphatase